MSKFKLSKTKPLVLVMGGSRGWGIKVADLTALLESELDLQVAVICGTNQVMASELKSLEAKYPDLRIMGNWSNVEVPELYGAAKILVTKPGGLTMAQALVRHLPSVLVNPLPTMEAMNQEYLVSRGLAISAKNSTEMRQWVERLLRDKKFYQGLQDRMKQFASAGRSAEIAARAIIDQVVEL